MDNRQENRPTKKNTTVLDNDEVSSKEWDFISLNEAEEDLVYRMHKLIGDRWELIAGRIPGRTAEEIERFWLMRHGEQFADKRKKCKIVGSSRSSSVKN